MRKDTLDTWRVIESTIGRTVRQLHRIVFVFKGLPKENAFLEISFDDGMVVFLSVAGDGESLRAEAQAWVDSFGGELDQTNREFVERHGKHISQDLSNEKPFETLVGKRVEAVHPIFDRFGATSGVQFIIGGHYLHFFVEWDESCILFGRNEQALAEHVMTVGKEITNHGRI